MTVFPWWWCSSATSLLLSCQEVFRTLGPYWPVLCFCCYQPQVCCTSVPILWCLVSMIGVFLLLSRTPVTLLINSTVCSQGCVSCFSVAKFIISSFSGVSSSACSTEPSSSVCLRISLIFANTVSTRSISLGSAIITFAYARFHKCGFIDFISTYVILSKALTFKLNALLTSPASPSAPYFSFGSQASFACPPAL